MATGKIRGTSFGASLDLQVERTGDDRPLKKCGLPLATVARMQLESGAPIGSVWNMLTRNGLSSFEAKNIVNSWMNAHPGVKAKQGLIKGSANVSGAASPKARVVAMQKRLRHVGMSDVRPTGKLDAPTVAAINNIFNGWDDAPEAYRTGTLTDRQIATNLGTVEKLVMKAVGGAQAMLDADKD